MAATETPLSPSTVSGKFAEKETEQQRTERIRVEERKRHAETTAAILRQRYGIEEE